MSHCVGKTIYFNINSEHITSIVITKKFQAKALDCRYLVAIQFKKSNFVIRRLLFKDFKLYFCRPGRGSSEPDCRMGRAFEQAGNYKKAT
jgi:hypothetical protein